VRIHNVDQRVRRRSPEIYFFGVVFDGFLTVFRLVFSPWYGFSAHGFLIPYLELGFRRLVETLYCIVNILYNAMKETKRAVKL
jgi:hypothetical protein